VGVVGICDFIRPNTSKSCRLCLEGGIQLVMLTGDRKETALNVAQEIGLLDAEDNIVLSSSDLKNMSDLEVCLFPLFSLYYELLIFLRVELLLYSC
jgi:magnesium-transporting ATPase (P-type)